MTTEALSNPKVFISYSWSSNEYQEWVVELANRLMSNGVEVTLDVWDLKVGQDKYTFMEQMVQSEDIDKVLILCDEKYKSRADERAGGVGDETQIISSEVYTDANQEKFIPIITYRDEEGSSFIPTYIKSRMYIDLSSDDIFEENYEQLLRNIFKVPQHQKPKLGKIPSFLTEREANHFETVYVVKRMKALADKQPHRLKNVAYDFTDKFFSTLQQFSIEINDDMIIDDEIVEKIEAMLPLRNDYQSMIKLLCEVDEVESEFIIEFFEKIFSYTEFKGNGRIHENQFDHYKFLIHELFLITVMTLLRYRRYETVSEITQADYYIDTDLYRGRNMNYSVFRPHLYSFQKRKERLKSTRISIQADLLAQRAGEYKNELVEADILLYFIYDLTLGSWSGWFPITYIYKKKEYPIKLLVRMSSKKHFDKVKCLFNVENKEEFIEKASNMEHKQGYFEAFRSLPIISDYIDFDLIQTKV